MPSSHVQLHPLKVGTRQLVAIDSNKVTYNGRTWTQRSDAFSRAVLFHFPDKPDVRIWIHPVDHVDHIATGQDCIRATTACHNVQLAVWRGNKSFKQHSDARFPSGRLGWMSLKQFNDTDWVGLIKGCWGVYDSMCEIYLSGASGGMFRKNLR